VSFSGGVGSWCAAKRVAERHGTADLTLLFCDTKIEDADTYRFLRESAANVGGQLVEIADGRTIWDLFRDERFLGNTRVDICSRVLKRELADQWLRDHCDPSDTVVYVGIDWSEPHRFTRLAARKLPWIYEAPLLEAPYLTKTEMHEWAEREGLRKQRLYQIGMAHANCGGGCVKAGVGHFARLLAADPERYAEWEANEANLRADLGDVSILRDRAGGDVKPLPLSALRERIEAGYQPDLFEIGGCGCMTDAPEEPTPCRYCRHVHDPARDCIWPAKGAA
jgi:hypothetical protein